jgi:hypothetical protein
MTTATAGVPITLVARFEAQGVLATPELPITLTVVPLAGGDAVVNTTTLVNPSTGIYTYAWTPDAVEAATEYLVTWDPSGDDTAASEVVTVLPAVSASWATASQALGFTGQTVTEAELSVASSLITLYSEADAAQAATSILDRDRYWLAAATSFQALWMRGKPGLLEFRESHTSSSADGVSTQRSKDTDIMLAPLAARALRNLSWIGARDILYANRARRPKGSFLSELHDPYDAWTSRPIT